MTHPKSTALPTISTRIVQYGDNSYGVEAYITRLKSEAQANAALEHVQRLLCGPEIKPQG